MCIQATTKLICSSNSEEMLWLKFQIQSHSFDRHKRCILLVIYQTRYFWFCQACVLQQAEKRNIVLNVKECIQVTFCTLQELFDLERWGQLVVQFRMENFQLHQLNDQSALAVTLQAGLSALKTPYPFVMK